MKRCPLCDFIYEDGQRLCDMDGIELVHDPAALLAPAKAAAAGPAATPKATRRRFLPLLLAGFLLWAALLSAYYISTGEGAPGPGVAAPPAAAPTPAPTPAPTASPVNDAAEAAEEAPAARPSPTPARPQPARSKAQRAQPEGRNKKRDSKIGSFLNKTGRILKKPFKF